MQVKPVDLNRASLELESLARPVALVGRLPTDLDGADRGRNLLDGTLEALADGADALLPRYRRNRHLDQRAIAVEALAGNVESSLRTVQLGLVHQGFDQLGRSSEAQYQHPVRRRVQRPGVTALAHAGDLPHAIERLGTGDARRLVEVDDPVHAGARLMRGRRQGKLSPALHAPTFAIARTRRDVRLIASRYDSHDA